MIGWQGNRREGWATEIKGWKETGRDDLARRKREAMRQDEQKR